MIADANLRAFLVEEAQTPNTKSSTIDPPSTWQKASTLTTRLSSCIIFHALVKNLSLSIGALLKESVMPPSTIGLLFLKIDNDFSRLDITFKCGNSNKMYMSEKIDGGNLVEIEKSIINLINSYVPMREKVYVVLDQENITQYKLEKMMPKLSSRIHQVIYTNV